MTVIGEPMLSGAFAGSWSGVGQRLVRGTWSRRYALQAVVDCAAWTVALVGAWAIVEVATVPWWHVVSLIAIACVLQVLVGWVLRLYRRQYLYGSFSELGAAATSALVIGGVLVVATTEAPAVVLLATFGALTLMGGSRYLVRLAHDSAQRPSAGSPVIVIGAGDAGISLVRQMLADPESPYKPVGFVDDDPDKRFLRASGVRVLGTTSRLAELAARTHASGVIVAIAQSDASYLRECRDRLAGTGVWLRTIPTIGELVTRTVDLDDVRNLKVEDLIGRSPVHTDLTEIAHSIRGKRVLVTGAGGSIGSELCRQLHALAPEALLMLDRDETALHGVELSIRGSALLTSQDTVLADIRDAEALDQLFAEARPDIVFHAAALKHLPMLQRFPLEGWKTNVHGTLNVLEAARKAGVTTFVNISTDKAAAPTSELGRSKRMGERLVAEYARRYPGTFLSVRFGNVLGSRGSVLHSFREQLRAGGPLTVTDPAVTRYFMTIPEACQLVLQAAVIGEDGCVMVLDMGEPVRIVDLAKNLIALADADAEIVFTGLRPGEKLDEELFGDYESDDVQVHDKISRVRVPALEVGLLPAPEAPLMTVADFVDEACDFRTAEIPVLPSPALETTVPEAAAEAAAAIAVELPVAAVAPEIPAAAIAAPAPEPPARQAPEPKAPVPTAHPAHPAPPVPALPVLAALTRKGVAEHVV